MAGHCAVDVAAKSDPHFQYDDCVLGQGFQHCHRCRLNSNCQSGLRGVVQHSSPRRERWRSGWNPESLRWSWHRDWPKTSLDAFLT